MYAYFPFPGCEEFCHTLQHDPTIMANATALLMQPGAVFRRALYKVSHYDRHYYLYTVDCDGHHFGNGMGIHEVHVATNLRDLQRAHGIVIE